jgi:hypothetical protein
MGRSVGSGKMAEGLQQFGTVFASQRTIRAGLRMEEDVLPGGAWGLLTVELEPIFEACALHASFLPR